MEPLVFERDGHIYIVGPVAPITPGVDELAGFAFAQELAKAAPNEHIMWLRGQYVEGDRANRNGQYWSSGELALKSLTPRFMPVTVMHDPRTAVGLIADTKLLTPDADKVPLSRIDTALAIWSHRFPEIAEECNHNYAQGTLMQSMECTAPHYDCIECGQVFVKMPNGAERANWCTHLNEAAETGIPVRRLRDVTFTGTGLIFGTRNGATGAMDKAHLDIFQSEVAEFHTRAVSDRRSPRRTTRMDDITITRSEYDALKAEAAKAATLAVENAALTVEVAKVATLTTDLEAAQIAQKAAEDARDAEKAAKEVLEESARTVNLATDRAAKLGAGFLAKLPEPVKTKLSEQAGTLSDEDWTARLEELALMTGVKADEGGTAAPAPGSAAPDETARTAFGAGGGTGGGAPSGAAVSTVLGGLFRQTRRPSPQPAPAQA